MYFLEYNAEAARLRPMSWVAPGRPRVCGALAPNVMGEAWAPVAVCGALAPMRQWRLGPPGLGGLRT